MMKIGIIGTGNVGSALATGFRETGHEVVLGSRTPDSSRDSEIDVTTQTAAADHGDVVILALPANVIIEVATTLRDSLVDKPVVDAANEYPDAAATESLARRVDNAVPRATVVKAFNTIGANRMTAPVIDGDKATMFVAGNDNEAVETVRVLSRDLGFDPVIAGDLTAASHLEDLARFWIHLSQHYGRELGFRLLQEHN